MTNIVKLPPEFISTNDIPVSVATIKRERMEEILREAVEADRKRRGEPVEEGWKLIAVNEVWDSLVRALDRAASKGYMPDAMGEEWNAFDWTEAPQPAESHVDRASRIVDSWPEWKRNYAITKHDVKPTQPATPAQEPSVPWENFPGYLIDHCEGEIISEEGLQHALSSMLQDPLYSDTTPAQEPSLPEGWRIVERQTCYALHQGNEVIALLSGPRAEDNAALLAGLLARYGHPIEPEGWRLVPVEPTDDMALAACRVGLRNPAINGVAQYQTMLEAAPKFGE